MHINRTGICVRKPTRKSFLVAAGLCAILWLPISFAAQAATVALAWDAPLTHTDSSALTDLAGYRVYHGTVSGVYTDCVSASSSSLTVSNLLPGSTHYFVVTACSSSGAESDPSAELALAVPLAVDPDTNANGIADVWETNHWGVVGALGAMAGDDPDHDGMSNLQEYIAGTDPLDANSLPLVQIGLRNDQVEVSFQSMAAVGPGYLGKLRYYTLQQCTNLAANVWTTVPSATDMPATGQIYTYATDAAAQTESVFYRVSMRLQ